MSINLLPVAKILAAFSGGDSSETLFLEEHAAP